MFSFLDRKKNIKNAIKNSKNVQKLFQNL